MIMMMNPTKTKTTFLNYFVLLVWGFSSMEVGLGQNQTSEIKVGVVLDLQTTFSKICLTSINMSLSDFYEDHPNYRTRLKLHVRDSMEDTVQASAAALDLIKNEQVSAIIGPRDSMQAEFMIRLAKKTQVPTITFSATSPLLTSIKSPYFVRATLNDSSQVKAIAAIFKTFGWRRVVAIYADNEFGEGFMPFFSDALQDVEVNRCPISPKANDDQILEILLNLKKGLTRVFVVHIESRLAFKVFQKAREIGMMEEGYVWLMTNGMTHMMRHIVHGRSLNTIEGVLGVRSHIPKSKKLEDFSLRWKRTFQQENPLIKNDVDVNVYALWAYDSITALAMAVEDTNLNSLVYDSGSALSNNRTDLGTVGVSRYGPSLLKALLGIRFNGLAGEFNLIDGQLESSKFEIINFIGNDQERIIGFWTPRNGLMNANPNETTSLGPVVWPGKSTVVPKGWEIIKKIKVGVPVKRGFFKFVNVTKDPNTNETIATGYAIDIFEAALKELAYPVSFEYDSFDSDQVAYNTLVDQVYEGKWDALVGDITITANRSLYVDFTLPYTESGVSMMVPVRDDENKNTWVFLKPWKLDLWVTTGCFFVFIGFVVWLFEHRVNTEFRGPPRYQIGTSFWFSFSTMVFAHRETVVSNLARFVVVVWCFVVLVLTQSYTASLTSFLTVQSFLPTVTNVNDLIKNGDIVGYQGGTFVKDILLGQEFNISQLKAFGSAKDADDFLANGTITVAFDEVAYLKTILSQSCSKYLMVEPTFKTAGFGFAFPKNSPLAGDVSRAILNMTNNNVTQAIENKWFPKTNDCPDLKTALSSTRLSLRSFWGLFLIAGIASFLSLVVFVAIFLYEQRNTLCDDSEDSLWKKLKRLVRIYDEKDIKAHAFKNSAVHNVGSPLTLYTPSPSPVQITSRSQSQNSEFELRRVSFTPSDERFNMQPIHHEDGESDIECVVEQ